MSWGDYTNRQRVGTFLQSRRDPTQSNPNVRIRVDIRQQTNYSTFNYNGTVSWSGDFGSGSRTNRLSGSTALTHHQVDKTFTARYSGSRSVTLNVSGTTAGTSGTSSHSQNYLVPRRPTADPTKPGRPSASNIRSDRVTLSWSAPSDMKGTSVDYYRVQISTNSSFSNIVSSRTTSSRSITVTGLSGDRTYYARVRVAANGWDSNRRSPYSNTRSFSTNYDAPGPVGGRKTTQTTTSGGRIEWSAPNDGGKAITKYEWQLRRSDQSTTRTGTIVQDSSSDNSTGNRIATLSGLDRYTLYQFWCRAYNGKWGPWQDEATTWGAKSFRTNADPPQLADYQAQSVARTSAQTGWVTIADTGGQSPNNVRTQYNTVQSETGATTVTRGSWGVVSLSGLDPYTIYYFRMAGANSTGGWGPWGPWRSFTTLDTSPDDPAAPTITEVEENAVTFTWTQPALHEATLESYTAVFAEYGRGPTEPVVSVSLSAGSTGPTRVGSPAFLEGVRYELFIRANASPSNSGFSPGADFYMPGTRETLFIHLREGSSWRRCAPYQRVDGVWRLVQPGFRADGVWKVGRSG